MRPLACLVAAGMLTVAAVPANAATIAYGEAFDTLYRIDLKTRVADPVGAAGRYAGVPIGNISGLTTLQDGTRLAVAGASKLFVQIDSASGTANVVAPLSLAGQGSGQFDALDLGMTSDCNDTIWLVSGTLEQLWTVDRQTGATTLVGPTGHAISGLVAFGDALYGSGSRADHTFYRIDKATGAARAIGDFGAAAPATLNSVSMSFDSAGILWAVLNYVPPTTGSTTPDWNDLATMDRATGQMTLAGPVTGPESLRFVGMKGFSVGPTQCFGSAGPSAAPATGSLASALLGSLLGFAGLFAAGRHLRV